MKEERQTSAVQVAGRDGTWSFIFVGFFNYYFGFFVVFVCMGFLENWGFVLFFFSFLQTFMTKHKNTVIFIYLFIYFFISSVGV